MMSKRNGSSNRNGDSDKAGLQNESDTEILYRSALIPVTTALQTFKPGQVVTTAAFMRASSDVVDERSPDAADEGEPELIAVFYDISPCEKTSKGISSGVRDDDEEAVIFPAGTAFRVKDVAFISDNARRLAVRLEEVQRQKEAFFLTEMGFAVPDSTAHLHDVWALPSLSSNPLPVDNFRTRQEADAFIRAHLALADQALSADIIERYGIATASLPAEKARALARKFLEKASENTSLPPIIHLEAASYLRIDKNTVALVRREREGIYLIHEEGSSTQPGLPVRWNGTTWQHAGGLPGGPGHKRLTGSLTLWPMVCWVSSLIYPAMH